MTEKQIITDEMRVALREPMPAEAVSQHPTKPFLSTIKAIYVVERLNDIFGIGGWTTVHNIVSDTPEYVTVSGHIHIYPPYNITTPTQYGGHSKTGKNTEPSDGYKSAVTDLQSKCASYLEIGIDVFKGKHSTGVTQAGFNQTPKQPPPKPASKPPVKQDTGGQPPMTDPQRKKIWAMCKNASLSDHESKEFFEFVLSNSEHGKTKEWASEFISNFDDYLGLYQDTMGVDKIA